MPANKTLTDGASSVGSRSDGQAVAPPPRPSVRAWCALAVASCFYLCDVFARLSLGVVTTTIQSTYHLSGAEVSLAYGSSFFIAYAIVQLPWGFLIDALGPRTCLAAATMIAAGGLFLTGSAPDATVGALARVLTGIGCGGAWLGVVKVLRQEFRMYPGMSGMLMGVATCLGGVGALGSQAPFAALVDWLGWRQAYHAAALLPVALCIGAIAVVRNETTQVRVVAGTAGKAKRVYMAVQPAQRRRRAPVNERTPKQAYVDPSEAPLVDSSAIQPAQGGAARPGPRQTSAASLGAVVQARATVSFGQRCRDTVGPLFKFLRTPRVWLFAAYCGFTDAPWETFAGLWGTAALEQGAGWDSGSASLWTSVNVVAATVSMIAAGPLLAYFTVRRHRLWLMAAAAAAGAVGYIPLVLLGVGAVPPGPISLGIILIGVSVMSAPLLWELLACDPLCDGAASTGVLSGVINTGIIVVDAVTQYAAGFILSALWTGEHDSTGGHAYSPSAYSSMFGLLLAEFVASSLCAACLAVRGLPSKDPQDPDGPPRRRSSFISMSGRSIPDEDVA